MKTRRTAKQQSERRSIALPKRFARRTDGCMSIFAPEIVSYDIIPPLQAVGAETFVTHWQEFLGSYQGPIHVEFPDVKISAAADVAFSYCLNRIATVNAQDAPAAGASSRRARLSPARSFSVSTSCRVPLTKLDALGANRPQRCATSAGERAGVDWRLRTNREEPSLGPTRPGRGLPRCPRSWRALRPTPSRPTP
jgi:hypothetical protein